MGYDVTVKEVGPERLAGVRGTYRIVELGEVMGREFARIMGAITAQGVHPSGGAVTVYHGWTEDTVDAEIAFTIDGDFAPQGDVKPSMLPGGTWPSPCTPVPTTRWGQHTAPSRTTPRRTISTWRT